MRLRSIRLFFALLFAWVLSLCASAFASVPQDVFTPELHIPPQKIASGILDVSGPDYVGCWLVYRVDALGDMYLVDVEPVSDVPFTKERDTSTGLDHHGFRYYDPEIGRYLTRDPIGYADGPNVYLYVHNNPVNFIDPLGLKTIGDYEADKAASRERFEKEAAEWSKKYPGGHGASPEARRRRGRIGKHHVDEMRRLDGRINKIRKTAVDMAYLTGSEVDAGMLDDEDELYKGFRNTYSNIKWIPGAGTATKAAQGEGGAAAATFAKEVAITYLGGKVFQGILGVGSRAAGSSGGRMAAGAIDDFANVPLQNSITGVSDDVLVHFAPQGYSVVKPGAGGQTFTFRYRDIKHLSPKQIETVIGPLSQGGRTGGARVMHVLETSASGATKTPGAVVSEIPEYILNKPAAVSEGFIVR